MSRQVTLVPEPPKASRRALLFGIAAAGVAAGPAVASTVLKAATVPPAETPLSGLALSLAPPAAVTPFPDAALRKNRIRKAHEAKYPIPDVLLVRPEDEELGLPNPWQRIDATQGRERVDRGGFDKIYDHGPWIEELRNQKWPVVEEIEFAKFDGLQPFSNGGRFAIRHIDPPSPAARARADEIVKAYDEWKPKHDREPKVVRAAQNRWERSLTKLNRLATKIDKSRARTLVGVMAKAHVASREAKMYRGDEAISASIVRDLLTLGETFPTGWPARYAVPSDAA